MLDIKGDKTLWKNWYIEGVGRVLAVEEDYYDGIVIDVEKLINENKSLTKRFHKQADYILNLEASLERVEKETIGKILGYIEKNCTEVEEFEEYLWKLLDHKI